MFLDVKAVFGKAFSARLAWEVVACINLSRSNDTRQDVCNELCYCNSFTACFDMFPSSLRVLRAEGDGVCPGELIKSWSISYLFLLRGICNVDL